MSVWAIIKNIGFLINAAQVIGHVISESIQGKKLPECSKAVEVVDIVEEALKRKVIDIPNVDEDAVAAWIEKTKNEVLTCKAPNQVS